MLDCEIRRQINYSTMSKALSSDDKSVLERKLVGKSILTHVQIDQVFEVERCIKWIQENDLQNVTLQFPDELLPFSAKVSLEIEEKIGHRVSILGDTSYGECCVDEVAAEHIGADGLIHFGNACLTPTRRLPVLHIYTDLPINIQNLAEQVKQKFGTDSTNLAIFYDVRYHRAFSQTKNIFENLQPNFNISICEPSAEAGQAVQCGRICPENLDENWVTLYVGQNENYSLLLGLTFSQVFGHFVFNVQSECPKIEQSSVNVKKALMKRYYLIERARDAARIGIIVGTLGVTRYRNVIDYVKDVVKKSGKKSYTFLVGKPNVPKLANFSEIDLFVLVACPENSVVDSKEYLSPIITPFELDVALNDNRDWTGQFVANFSDILPKGPKHLPFRHEHRTDISLITGKIRATNLQAEDSSSLALATQETALSTLHKSGGGEYLLERSWQGLEQKLGETEVKDAVEGRSGIASGYIGEGM